MNSWQVRTVPAKGNYSFQIEIQREPVGFDLGTFAPPQQMQQNQMRVDAGYHQQPIQPQQAHRQSMQPQQAHRQSMQPQQPHRESMQPQQQQQQQQQPGMLQGRPIPQHAGMRVRDKTPVPQGTPARAVLGGTPVRSHTPIRFDGHVQRGQHPSPAVHTIVGYTPQGVPITVNLCLGFSVLIFQFGASFVIVLNAIVRRLYLPPNSTGSESAESKIRKFRNCANISTRR